MALVNEIIKDAYREANLISLTQSPTLDEQAEALRLLNRFVRSLFGNEAGESFETFSVEDYPSDYVPANSRIVLSVTNPLTITLHPDPEDGARLAIVNVNSDLITTAVTVDGNGRNIEESSTLLLDQFLGQREWFYRADLGSWMRVTDLQLSDTFPFPTEFDDLFTIGLATRLNPRNGVALDDQAMMHFRRTRSLFRSRYSQTNRVGSDDALVRLTGVRYNRTDYLVKGY